MEYGVTLAPRDEPAEFVPTVELAESVGFDFAGIADSQSLFRELYSTLSLAADRTESIRLGPTITTAVTRHPVVTASGLCTVNEISEGRAFAALGTGDSAVYTLGERPSKLAEMEEVIPLLQSLFGGESVEYDGSEVRLKWVQEERATHDIPVILAAEGPKTLRTAGRVADGVLIGTGLTTDVLEDSIERVNEGARESGRDPEEVEKLVFTKINVAETREAAVDEIKMALAASANHAFRFTLEGKNVPEEYREPIRELQREYVPHEHEDPDDETTNRELVERLSLTEYLANRFTVVGPPDDCIDRLAEIEDVDGLDGILLANLVENDRELLDALGREVLPSL